MSNMYRYTTEHINDNDVLVRVYKKGRAQDSRKVLRKGLRRLECGKTSYRTRIACNGTVWIKREGASQQPLFTTIHLTLKLYEKPTMQR